MRRIRVGQIVPSSNTTMETEIPELLRAREGIRGERFSFHSSRMRMQHVEKSQLAAMDAQSLRCAAELADARMDVMAYACLVAIMATGLGYHCVSEQKLSDVARQEGGPCPVITSAGALVEAIQAMGAKRVSIMTPYMRPLTDLVVAYIEDQGIEVIDSLAFEIPDNLDVGARDAMLLLKDVERLNVDGADLVIGSACVQMPSLAAIEPLQDKLGKPVISAAISTVWKMLRSLDLEPVAPGGGKLLSA